MIGHCGGLRSTQTIGDYVLAHAYLRDDHVMDDVLPLEIPIPALAEVQMALTLAAEQVTGETGDALKARLRTGTVVTTDDRNWELRYSRSAKRFNQSRAVAIDMESATIAAQAMLAGITDRFGYGFGLQRLFLNRGPFLPGPSLRLHPFDQATAWLAAAGIPMAEAEPILPTTVAARDTVRQRLGDAPGRLVAVGIGSSEPYKQWGAARFAMLADSLLDDAPGRVVLIGGPAEADLAREIQTLSRHGGDRIVTAIGWDLAEIAALCAASAFYVCNDTGVMNIAAAVGLRSYGLFGGTPPFHHSRRIVAITPPDGSVASGDPTGMARITPETVLRAIRTG